MNRVAQAFWSAHSRIWDDALADQRVVAHIDELADWLAGAVPGGGIVVDLGCGTGNYVRAMTERGLHVLGVDSSRGMLARAATKVRALARADVLRLPLPDASVNAALSVYSAQFFTLDAFLVEPRRVLKPGGALLIELPQRLGGRPRGPRSFRFVTFQQVKRVVAFVGRRAGRVHLHSPDDVRRALTGFDVVQERTTHSGFAMLATRAG